MGKSDFKILLVDDEPDILEFVGYNIRKEGYILYTSSNGKEAITIAKEVVPHLIILDVMMPEMDGIETCKEIKRFPELKNTIITFLSARGEDFTQIAGLEAGGDDYITKPIKPRVLMSRINALLRRSNSKQPNKIFTIGDITIDNEKYLILKSGTKIILPKKEFELLSLLISKPNKVFTREEIFSQIWGNDIIVGDRTIDVHVRKIREKLGDDRIKTVKGVGYKYEY